MVPKVPRIPTIPTCNVNLHCLNCDAQLGFYENEWMRLTATYIVAKEKGEQFGTDVAERAQEVPPGPTKVFVEGCMLSETSCQTCDEPIGHYCRGAPPDKAHLIDHHFFRLSRIYLRDRRTLLKVEPVLGFGGVLDRMNRERSAFPAPSPAVPTPSHTQKARKTSRRQSMAPPDDPYRHPFESPATASEYAPGHRANDLHGQRAQSTFAPPPPSFHANAQHDSQYFDLHPAVSHEQADRNNDFGLHGPKSSSYMLPTEKKDISIIIQKLTEQDAKFAQISQSIDAVKIGLGKLISSLRESGVEQLATASTSEALTGFMDDFQSIVTAADEAASRNAELERLRAENEAMKSKLEAVTSALGSGVPNITPAPSPSQPVMSPSFLGKRKRLNEKRPSLLQNEISRTDSDGSQDSHHDATPAIGEGVTPTPVAAVPAETLRSSPVRCDSAEAMEGVSTTLSKPRLPHSDGYPLQQATQQVPTPPASNGIEQDRQLGQIKETTGNVIAGSEPAVERASGLQAEMPDTETNANDVVNLLNGEKVNQEDTVQEVNGTEPDSTANSNPGPTTRSKQSSQRRSEARDVGEANPQQRADDVTASKRSRRKTTEIETREAEGHLTKKQQRKSMDALAAREAPHHGQFHTLRDMRPRRKTTDALFIEDRQLHQTGTLMGAGGYRIRLEAPEGSSDEYGEGTPRVKRPRRRPEEVNRKYKCLWEGCNKAYGSLPHLNTHIVNLAHGEKYLMKDYFAAKELLEGRGETFADDSSAELEELNGRNETFTVQVKENPVLMGKNEREEKEQREKKIRERDRLVRDVMEREEMGIFD